MKKYTITKKEGASPLETLRIKGKKIQINVSVYAFKQDEIIVYYVPSLEVSSYGDNDDEADEMLKNSLIDFCNYITDLPYKKQQLEIQKLGWKKNKYASKQYSKAYIDEDGLLKNLHMKGELQGVKEIALEL